MKKISILKVSTEVKAVFLMIGVVAGGIVAALAWMDTRYADAAQVQQWQQRSDMRVKDLEEQIRTDKLYRNMNLYREQLRAYLKDFPEINKAPDSVKNAFSWYLNEYTRITGELGVPNEFEYLLEN